MIDRRSFVIGGTCLAAAASAEGLRPKQRLNLLGKASIEEILPATFGPWSQVQIGTVVQPRRDAEGTTLVPLRTRYLGHPVRRPEPVETVRFPCVTHLATLSSHAGRRPVHRSHRPTS